MAKQNTIRKTIHRNVERELVREYLLRETERAGYGGLKFNRTCLLYTSDAADE